MILGPKKLLERVKKIKLVEGLAERELKTPEGAGFDLRLGELYKIKGKAFLGEVERQTPKIILYKLYKAGKKTRVEIKPGQYFLATTIEKGNTPLCLTINCTPKHT